MNGLFPPSSRLSFLPEPAVALRMMRPTSVEPVNAILSTSGCSTIAAPVSPWPFTMLITPGGNAGLVRDLREAQRRERRELRRLENNRITGR